MELRFKVGDKVRRTKLGTNIERNELALVVETGPAGAGETEWIRLAGKGTYKYDVQYFELVSRPVATKPEVKDSNPKEAIGATKLALHLVPDTLGAYAAVAFYEGATKYGAYNWRVAGVRASTYKAAAERHLKKWFNGEEVDPKTKVPHLANALACIGILLDAQECGKLNDDRPPYVDMESLFDKLAGTQAHLSELHKGMNPKHYTEANKE